MPQPLLITKSSGELVPFDAAKLRRSLIRASADPELADRIVAHVSARITQGMSTRALYRMALGRLHKRSHHAAARYRFEQGFLDAEMDPCSAAVPCYGSQRWQVGRIAPSFLACRP